MRRKKVLIDALLVALLSTGLLRAGTLHLIAVDGQPALDGNGVFDGFLVPPVLNNHGVVGFHATYGGYTGGFTYTGMHCGVPGQVVLVARGGQAVAALGEGGVIQDSDYQSGSINDAGKLAFKTRVSPVNGFAASAVFLKEPAPDAFTMLARTAGPAPGEGAFTLSDYAWRPVLGAGGHVAFHAGLSGTDGGTADDSAIFVSDAAGTTVSRVVQKGEIVPGGTETMQWFSKVPAVNASGQVAFATRFGFSGTDAIVRGQGGALSLIARTSTAPAPPGESPIRDLTGTQQVMMNASGTVAFTAGTTLPSGSNVRLVIKAENSGNPEIVAASGMELSGSGIVLGSSINPHPCINNAGQVAYEASLAGFSGKGIVLDQTLIAKGGDPLPGGGTIVFFAQYPFSLNQSGQVAFLVQVAVPGLGNGYGIYLHDGNGLQLVARYGTSFLGSTITDVGFAGTSALGVLPPGMNGLNDAGEVAFRFTLADGRQGIALWSSLPKAGGGSGRIERIAGGFRVKFPGIPGWSYQVERDEDLLPPWEVVPVPIQADPAGWVIFDDLGPGLPARRFYRCFEAP